MWNSINLEKYCINTHKDVSCNCKTYKITENLSQMSPYTFLLKKKINFRILLPLGLCLYFVCYDGESK